MLSNLYIKNFILIKSLNLDIDPQGLIVISGETGAGKSILLDALIYCLGGKVDVRLDDNEIITVCATFVPSFPVTSYLAEYDIVIEDELIIKRTQHKGKRKFFISDQPVTQQLIQDLSSLLLEVHGQHAHTLLNTARNHQKILDEYAVLSSDLQEYQQEFSSLKALQAEYAELQQRQQEIESEVDYLSHVVKELDEAEINENEEQELAEKQLISKERRKLLERLANVQKYLNADDLCSSLVTAQKEIARHFDEPLEKMYSLLDKAYNDIENAVQELEEYKDKINDIGDGLDIEDRLYLIRDLARKYQIVPQEIPNLLENSRIKLERLSGMIAGKDDLQHKITALHKECIIKAQEISAKRQAAALKLQTRISKEFAALQMKGAEFIAQIEQDREALKSSGCDKVRFVARTNQGSSLNPIDKVASGGELSRFMLAIKIALLEKGSMQTILFDEIDTGVGGAAASSVGGRLAALGHSAQVIVITHQAQVAAFATQHIKVSKAPVNGETRTSLSVLDKEGVESELARMLSGKEITEKSLSAAREMQQLARN